MINVNNIESVVEEAAGCVVLSGDCSSVMMSKVVGEFGQIVRVDHNIDMSCNFSVMMCIFLLSVPTLVAVS